MRFETLRRIGSFRLHGLPPSDWGLPPMEARPAGRERPCMAMDAGDDYRAEPSKALLCAVDRRTAATVARVAGDLAFRLGSRLVLAGVAEEPAFRHSRAQRERARALKRTGQQLDGLAGELPKALTYHRRVELGTPSERLLEVAREEDAELIVVGSRGRGALGSALLGSVSRDVARRAPCPVMIVTPQALKYSLAQTAAGGPGGSGIVCGVDGSWRSLAAARLAADLARRLGDRLVLVHAYDATKGPPPGATDGYAAEANPLEVALESIDGPGEGRLRPLPAAFALESVANREGARLIAVGARDRGDLQAALLGSGWAQLVRLAGCPIVVLPEHAELGLGSGHYEAAPGALRAPASD